MKAFAFESSWILNSTYNENTLYCQVLIFFEFWRPLPLPTSDNFAAGKKKGQDKTIENGYPMHTALRSPCGTTAHEWSKSEKQEYGKEKLCEKGA